MTNQIFSASNSSSMRIRIKNPPGAFVTRASVIDSQVEIEAKVKIRRLIDSDHDNESSVSL